MKHLRNSPALLRRNLSAAIAALTATACQAPTDLMVGNSSVTIEPQPSTAPTSDISDPGHTVCNPLDNQGESTTAEHGLLASLKYLPNGNVDRYSGIVDFMKKATPVNVQIFFNQLNVPTRMFDEGFVTNDGETLRTPNGDTLYEYFSLSFDSVIRLTSQDAPGLYQFAIISDDGSALKINSQDTGMKTFLSNDGDHPSQMACASKAISFDQNTTLPIHLDYFQGPRFHISLILLWRRVANQNSSSLSDSACGQSGNELFFDPSNVPSTPKQYYKNILARGWKVVSPSNFYLVNNAPLNPCVDPSPSPSASPSASPSPSPSASPSECPSPSPSPSPSTSPSASPSASPSESPSPSPTDNCSGNPFCGGGILGN